MLERLRLALEDCGQKVNSQVVLRRSVHVQRMAADERFNAQFLPELALKGFDQRFSGLDLAAR